MRTLKCGEMGLRLACLALVGALSACGGGDPDASQKVNGSVHIPAGKAAAPANTVNGAIDIDDNAAVTEARAVNGSVRLGANATADSLGTVNGNITIGAGAKVAKESTTVNGGVVLRDGAEALGAVTNVNGKIELLGAHVAGGIKTVTGSITISGPSHVEGGILVEKPGGISIHLTNDVPRIEIGPGATVQGDLRFEREVKLYVSDRANIGTVTGATPITFSGAAPPDG